MKKTIRCFLILTVLTGCKKDYDLPPVKHAQDGSRISIAEIKKRFLPDAVYRFSGDTNLYCVVTADETSGNLYKDVYIRDATGALHVKLTSSGGLAVGDSIRINLSNVILNHYANLVQLDSVDVSKNVVKLASGTDPQPETVTIHQIMANTSTGNLLQSKLVRINNVEFLKPFQNQPYANIATKASVQYTLQDCEGNNITLRTSGYASFAGQTTPGGNGSIVAIISQYYTNIQLLIRGTADVNMSGSLCAPVTQTTSPGQTYLSKNFDDNSVISGGWTVQQALGSINWSTSTKGGAPNPYCQISNYAASVNTACETWLISPALAIASATNPVLTFKNAYSYNGPPLGLYVSTNYTGGLPSTATWTQVPFAASTGSFVFAGSGNILLGEYKTNTTRMAFKYTGTNSSGSTWELDDIVVKEN